MIKTHPERVKTQMYVALQIATALGVLSEPFLPFTANKMVNMLQTESINWDNVSKSSKLLKPGHKIGQGEILFAQIDDAEIQKQIDKLEGKQNGEQNR